MILKMGGESYNMNSCQFDFIKEESYTRKGCFVTTPKAILYVIIAIISLIIVALVMYYYGPYSSVVKTIEKSMDIEKLLNDSVGNISQDIRLPKDLEPTFYQLKIDPKIGFENSDIYEGEVTIRFKCKYKTKTIVLNAENLDINNIEVFRIDSVQNRTKRDVLDNNTNENLNEIVSNSTNFDLSNSSLNFADSDGFSTLNSVNEEITTISGLNSFESTSFSDLKSTTMASRVIEKDRMDKNYKKLPDEILSTTFINITTQNNDPENLKYSIRLKKDLEQNKDYLLKINFKSNITEAFHGLYKIISDNKSLILATKLHPIYARKLFPCFDEPNFKAPFQLTIKKSNENHTVLSNSDPFKSFKDENGSVWEEFQVTNSLPAYSFGFIIGDLNKIDEEMFKTNCFIRIWSLNQNSFIKGVSKKIFEFTKKILIYFEGYFLIDFPLEKIDFVFLKDLRFTTPNSGLIFLKEALILNEKDLFNELSKSLIKEWVGNLVSISWWDDFWFINAFSVFILEDLQLSENLESDFVLEVTQETLQSDDLKSALSLESEVENVIQIYDIADKNKYNKGGCLLKMLNFSLAPLTFQKGVQTFLKEWKNKSTGVKNLWKSFDLVTTKIDKLPENETISKITESWSSQASFPLVSVIKNIENDTLRITQKRFHDDLDNNLWAIPTNYITGNNIEEKFFWLTKKLQTQEVKDLKSKWVLLNYNYNGYYRVNYDLENWKMLINTLHENHLKIPIKNRGQLINDAFELAENGFLDYHVPFNLTKYLINETDYIPWASALKSLEFIKSILETTYLNGDYEDYITNLIGPIYDKIKENDPNKNEDKEHEVKFRKLIIETACSVNYQNCTKWALEKLNDFLKNTEIENFPHRKTILCTGIRLSGRKEWEIIFSKLKLIQDDVEDFYYALGCTKHAWLINKYLSATLNGTIPIKYVSNVWKSIRNVPGRNVGFKFLRENWRKIYQIYKEKRLVLKTIIQDFLFYLSTKSDKEDLTLFFGKFNEDLQGFSYLLKVVVDRIDSRIIWKEKYLDVMDKWFSS
nr:aminopeptidase N-like isoform X1 [Onthophagus taurus]